MDFDGGGEEAGELDEEVALAGASCLEEEALDAVEGAGGDDAYGGAVHCGSDLAGGVVAGGVGGRDGGDDAAHVGVGDGHGGAVGCAAEVAVLEGVGAPDDGVEAVFNGVDEEEVMDEGHLLAYGAALALDNLWPCGCEYGESECGEPLVCGLQGVGACEVAQYVPGGLGFCVHLR